MDTASQLSQSEPRADQTAAAAQQAATQRIEARLLLSTQAQVWTGTPLRASDEKAKNTEHFPLRNSRQHGQCMYCGFVCSQNDLHHINDNHEDDSQDNLGVACALCHAWCHLGELAQGDGYLCYLPGVSPADVNHLQRTIFLALASGDEQLVSDAKDILNWLGSHREYVAQAWGTDNPATFASAIRRQPIDEKELREIVFTDLALIAHPGLFIAARLAWAEEVCRAYPASIWPRVYHGIANAPL